MIKNPVPLTKFRENLTELLNETVARDGEHVVIARNGEPFAVVMDIDEYEDMLELQDPHVQAMIRESAADVRAGRVHPADELLAELRAMTKEARGKHAAKNDKKARAK
jgi:prevent-host-death family protein